MLLLLWLTNFHANIKNAANANNSTFTRTPIRCRCGKKRKPRSLCVCICMHVKKWRSRRRQRKNREQIPASFCFISFLFRKCACVCRSKQRGEEQKERQKNEAEHDGKRQAQNWFTWRRETTVDAATTGPESDTISHFVDFSARYNNWAHECILRIKRGCRDGCLLTNAICPWCLKFSVSGSMRARWNGQFHHYHSPPVVMCGAFLDDEVVHLRRNIYKQRQTTWRISRISGETDSKYEEWTSSKATNYTTVSFAHAILTILCGRSSDNVGYLSTC